VNIHCEGNGSVAIRFLLQIALAAAPLASSAPAVAASAAVVDSKAIASRDQGGNWLSVGRNYAEDRYSPLSAIRAENVQSLGLAWSLELPGQRSLQSTPLAVEGVLYFTGTNGKTFAVDGRSGRQLWEVDPDLANNPINRRQAIWGSNHGVAFWRGKVYVGFVDGRLAALDARTGKVVWSVQTFDEEDTAKVITGAPRVFNGKVIIGHGGESGTRGYVTTYDAETGKKLWRFHTVPGDPAKGFENPAMARAANTWRGEWWKQGGNATVWDNTTYDPELNRVYFGTANGTPLYATVRSPGGGDNLFVASIIALDADSGQYVWHYQLNPAETWEYDATQQIVLADLTIGGKRRKVLMQAPKNGFFYVIDRVTGKLISAEKLGKVTWAEKIDLKTGRPVEDPLVRQFNERPIHMWPSSIGIHNWQPMSFDPVSKTMYIPIQHLGQTIGPSAQLGPRPQGIVVGANTWELRAQHPDDGTSSLLAWDPIKQVKKWEVRYPESFWNGGTLVTAGNLVFQGTDRGDFIAYDSRNGAKLWSFNVGLGINAGPMTYAIDGIQYVSVLVGYGGTANVAKAFDKGWRFNDQPRRLLTFALGGRGAKTGAPPPRYEVRAVDDASLVIDPKVAAAGKPIYDANCMLCHGFELQPYSSIHPDLRESYMALSWDAFKAVLHDGVRISAGMPKFENLSEQELRSLHLYIRQRARDALPPNANPSAK
jgi:quinohemoprotein ethanol dehydrogenase